MKKLLLLTKMLLAVALLCVGQNAWGREISTSWKVQSTTPTAASTILMDDDLITATTTFATTLTEESKTIAGESFTHYIQVRNAAYPTVDVPTGTEQSGSTSVVITPKFDGELTIYYMRQSTAQTDNKGTYNLNDGKDVKVFKQSDASVLSGIMTIDTESDDGKYGWATKVVSLEANTDYTISAKGTTARLYGLKFTYDDGLVEETYDFSGANSTNTSVVCSYGPLVSINGTDCNILSNSKLEMNDRFAGQVANGSSWNVYKSSNGLGTTVARKLGVLNLSKDDYVIITFTGTAPTFIGNSNISGQANGTAVVSGEMYKMIAAGNLELSVPRAASTDWTYIKSVTIYTSTPVLRKPIVSFNSMVESEGLYYPKYTFSSADDGVKFYDGDGNDITSGYTFTSAGSQTVYAGKDGRTNSAKVSFSADKVGMILANSVTASSLDGNSNYNGGSVAYGGDIAGTWAVPGINFESTKWNYYTSNVQPVSGGRTLSCSVLNTNRVATVKRNGNYDYLTSTSNSVSYARYDQFQQYDLYVLPSEEVSVTIGSTGYSTFSSPVPLNFAGISGLTAYVATTVADGTVTLTSVETAPANTGLVLKGTAGLEYSIPVTNAAVAPASNLLVGCIVETVVAKDATSGFNNYVLAIEGGVAKFQSLVDMGATIPAGKAFLKNGAVGGGSARALRISFDDITGVANVEAAAEAKAKEGKFIENGKLVIVKNGVKYNAAGAKLY